MALTAGIRTQSFYKGCLGWLRQVVEWVPGSRLGVRAKARLGGSPLRWLGRAAQLRGLLNLASLKIDIVIDTPSHVLEHGTLGLMGIQYLAINTENNQLESIDFISNNR